MNKTYFAIDKLKEWDKNPRSITSDGFERLKKQILKLGQYKPLIITQEGIVLGGNMRIKAIRFLVSEIDKAKIEEIAKIYQVTEEKIKNFYAEVKEKGIWVNIVKAENENEMFEYALSDNDRAGFYDSDLLANYTPQFEIDWKDYAVDVNEPIVLDKLINGMSDVKLPSETQEEEKEFHGVICVLKMGHNIYQDSKDAISQLCEDYGISINITQKD